MKKIIKRVTAIVTAFTMTFGFCRSVIADESVEVYVTVSDITDYTQPINILVERQKIEVSNFNLANFGDTMSGIECVEGITYLHALTQLHRNLYGDTGVKDKLLLTPDGVTKIFMGRSVANVMYKNGRDIFSLPQLVNIKDGDEIQVCLYDEGHSQAIATFREARLDNVAIDENIGLKLEQHYGFPRDRDPIGGAEITDGEGNYITDENGDIITTDEGGNFNISFSDEGSYTISAMPQINYYMSDTGGGIKIEWIPQIVQKPFDWTVLMRNAETDPEGAALYEVTGEAGAITIFDWNAQRNEPFMVIGKDIDTEEKTVTGYEEVTELVKVETVTSDELAPMVTYTTPLVVVNVTDDIVFENVCLNGYNLSFRAKNSALNQDIDLWVAGYSVEDGLERFEEVKTIDSVQKDNTVKFSGLYDRYKIMCWYDGTMTPAYGVYVFEPSAEVSAVAEYDFTNKPTNTYITTR